MHSALCSTCGKPLPVSAAFCGDCGAPQKPAPVTPLTTVTPPPTSEGAALSAGALPSVDHAPNQLPLLPASHAAGPMNSGGSGPGSPGPLPQHSQVSGPQAPMMPLPAYTPGPPPAVKPGNGENSSGEKSTRERIFSFGNMMAMGGLIVAIIGLLITLNVIHPFTPPVKPPNPTATPNLQAFTDPDFDCSSDNTGNYNALWHTDGQQSSSFTCNAAGTGIVITQQPKAQVSSTLELSLPLPHEPLTRDYSISVQISDLALPQSCAGVFFRHFGYRAYAVAICLTGVWDFAKSFATSGLEDVLNHGTFTLKAENTYLLSVEVSNETATISIDGQPLPSVTLDPTFKDGYIDLFVDGNDPLSTSIDPSINPGASATFSQFIFQPLD